MKIQWRRVIITGHKERAIAHRTCMSNERFQKWCNKYGHQIIKWIDNEGICHNGYCYCG